MAQRILIVDDELHLIHVLSYKLKKAGYELLAAHNGRDGFELACQHKPDLVLTDYQMPVLNGFEMAVKLRENPDTAGVPLIMLTARGHKILPEQLAQTNIKVLMAKPFSSLQLLEAVADILVPSAAATPQGTDPATGEDHDR